MSALAFFFVSSFVLFACCFLDCSFLKGSGKVSLQEKGCGEDLGRVEGGKTVVGMYYMKENLFSTENTFSRL